MGTDTHVKGKLAQKMENVCSRLDILEVYYAHITTEQDIHPKINVRPSQSSLQTNVNM